MIKIVSMFDKHQDFIELQYNSILNHIKGDYEYIIFNNASTDEQANLNKKECDRLGIKCIRIHVNYGNTPSLIAGEALNKSFEHFSTERVFKIDSDMFFTSDINLDDILSESDLFYIPNYKPGLEIMWSGVFGINLSKVNIKLDFHPGVTHGTDTFGQSSQLTVDTNLSKKVFNLYNLQDINNGIATTSLNVDCLIKIENGNIIEIERSEYINNSLLSGLTAKYKYIEETMIKYQFPTPYNIDIIELDGVDFIIHFKSSNWCPWYTEEYIKSKKEALKKYLNKNYKSKL